MILDLLSLNLPETNDVSLEVYNDKVNRTEEDAELVVCHDVLNQAVDELNRLLYIQKVVESNHFTDIVKSMCEALTYSVEINIFDIIGAVVKTIWRIAKWVVNTIGKLVHWVTKFFSRRFSDAVKISEEISDKMPQIQNETVGNGISVVEFDKCIAIIKEHCDNEGSFPTSNAGMKVEDYRTTCVTTFNNALSTQARVNHDGTLVTEIKFVKGARVGTLGWVDEASIKHAVDEATSIRDIIKSTMTKLRGQGKVIEDVVNTIENSKGKVTTAFIQDKTPAVINAAVFCSVIVKDSLRIDRLENTFNEMTLQMRKLARKYVAATP